ncbi:MAG: hypothetical protein IJ410_03545 [Oscillospiraceae bacterium]|nr:hypothetical protein [Oscillospiraceae bacterium]
MKIFDFSLQLKGEENKIIGNVVQNDTANRFVVRLKDGITPYKLTDTDIITVTYRRGNDTIVADAVGDGRIAVTDYDMGEVTIHPHTSAVLNVGMVTATVEVYDKAGKKLTSARFSYTVTPDAANDSDASLEDEFPALQALISYMAVKNDEFETAEGEREAAEADRKQAEQRRRENEAQRQANEEKRQETLLEMEGLIEEAKKLTSMDVEVVKNTASEYILRITDKDGSFDTPNLKGRDGKGSGDMSKAVYDTDGDGVVDKAKEADNGISVYDHEVNGTVHKLIGTGSNAKLNPVADWQPGDTMTINGYPAYPYNQLSENISGEVVFKTHTPVFFFAEFVEDRYNCFFRLGGGGLSKKALALATAVAADVTAGVCFYSGDEKLRNGTLPDIRGEKLHAVYKSIKNDEQLIHFSVPQAGRVDTGSSLYGTFAEVAELIGLTADKIIEGKTILGIEGTAKTSTGANGTFTSLSNSAGENNVVTIDVGLKPTVVMATYMYDSATTGHTVILYDQASPDTYKLWYGTVVGEERAREAEDIFGYIEFTETGFTFRGYHNSSGGKLVHYVCY